MTRHSTPDIPVLRQALRVIAPLLIALALFVDPALAQAQERLKLAVGQRGNWDTSVAELGQRSGIFKKHGLDLQILYTDGGGETLQAVLSRSVDVGVGVGVMGVLGAFSKGAPIRVIGAEVTGAGDLFWYVRADSPIRTLRDTAGKTIAYSTNGSSTNGVVQALLDQYGLKARPTATGGPASTLTQVMSGQIDVGWSAPPFGLDQLDRKQIRIIANGNDAEVFRGQTVRFLAAHAQVLQTRGAAMTRFMRGYRETLDWMFSNPEAVRLYARFANIPEPLARRSKDEFFTRQSMDPDRILGLNLIMDDAVRLKYMTRPLSQAQLAQLIQIPAR
jgi:NitT/TauT family transport system substrate-binding protein